MDHARVGRWAGLDRLDRVADQHGHPRRVELPRPRGWHGSL